MLKIKNFYLLLINLIFLMGCTSISPFNEIAYQQSTSIKATALLLINHGNEDYSLYVKQVEELKLDMEKAYEYAKARPKNEESTKQWEIMKNPEGNSLGSFLKKWREKGNVSEFYIEEKKKMVSIGFDTISELEIKKLKN